MVSNDTYITTVSASCRSRAQELKVPMMTSCQFRLAVARTPHARPAVNRLVSERQSAPFFCLSGVTQYAQYPTGNLFHKRCCARDAKRQAKMSFGGRGRGFGGRSPGRGGRFGGRGGRGGRGRGEEGPPDEVVGAFCVLEELGPHLICSQLNCLFAVLPEPNAVIFL